MTIHRLLPLEPPYPADIEAALERYPKRDGYLLSLFRVFANSPRFLRKCTANLLDRNSPLPMRERELVILRVCGRRNCEYEWGVHVGAFADHVGFTAEQIEATRLGAADAACWTDRERTLLKVVDELCRDGTLASDTRDRFQGNWAVDAQLEILALAGNYQTISFVANVADLPPEPFAARFPGP